MRVAFYKAKKGTFTDKLIAWWTRPNLFKFWKSGPYSHVEILFEDTLCFSASQREGKCRWKYINDIETSGKWDIYQVTDNPNIISHTKLLCTLEDGKGYDWLCIFFNFILPFNSENRNKWTCSELVAKKIFYLRKAYKYSPNSLFFKIINKQKERN